MRLYNPLLLTCSSLITVTLVQPVDCALAICNLSPTKRDLANGVNIIPDATCAMSGMGCLSKVCRVCRTSAAYVMDYMMPCELFTTWSATLPPTTTAPEPTTPAPTTPTPTTSQSTAPEPSVAGAFEMECTMAVSGGDAAVGISVLTDLSCMGGGLGCENSVCRLCRIVDTPQSAHFTACEDLQRTINNGQDVHFVAIPEISAEDSLSVEIRSSSEFPQLVSVSQLLADLGPVFGTTSIKDLPLDPCAEGLSEEERKYGIWAVTDLSCVQGGAGCTCATCRTCWTIPSPYSDGINPCESVIMSANLAFAANQNAGGVENLEVGNSIPTWSIAGIGVVIGVSVAIGIALILVGFTLHTHMNNSQSATESSPPLNAVGNQLR